ncbi:MAG: cell division/cell wall cluster transcriptional repressor MraZ [Candidatus Woykebacteria bacterium RBG_13_40_15]|uniref:Transcriptional regulator MraZ n=1 Tax=Candidatus Woykebacteria bacterium RBG_13_40_15 TaxID=1802593 RepID=A0A1G1WAD9_9BACT|nr:MAG: cell division/cell wall cluster transcriptional repressor MraZ [Candidatus Woykebacteria bacterium RBG_13_40_15]
MLLGEYQHNLDNKGRLAVPKKFRGVLGRSAILTKGLDGCLFLYPRPEWERLSSRLRELPVTQADTRAFERYLFGGAVETEFDSLGRIKIPGYLRSYANLEKESVTVGVLERIEIWDKERWYRFSKKLHARGEEIAEKLAEKGI